MTEEKLQKQLDGLTRQVDRVVANRKVDDLDLPLMRALAISNALLLSLVHTATTLVLGTADISRASLERLRRDFDVQNLRLLKYMSPVDGSEPSRPLVRGVGIPWPISPK